MKLVLYAHPFSAYCQKALVALYENDTPFTYRMLGPNDPAAATLNRGNHSIDVLDFKIA